MHDPGRVLTVPGSCPCQTSGVPRSDDGWGMQARFWVLFDGWLRYAPARLQEEIFTFL